MELIFEERASKGVVKDYYSGVSIPSKEYKEPPYAYKILMDMVEADPILFAAVSLTADLVTYNGYSFTGKNARDVERANKMFNDDLDFDQVLDNVLWQLIIYGDSYMEMEQDNNKIVALHPLESTEMVIDYTKNFEITKYYQKIANKTQKDWPSWTPEEVIFFRLYWVGTQVYSRSPFKAVGRSYSTKVYAQDYLTGIFRNLPPKIVYFLKGANDRQRKVFIENNIRAKTNPQIDLIAQGEAFEAKLLEPNFSSELIKILEYLRKDVLTVTRVPPHWVGMLDGANRGIGENVVIPYETKIKKLQQKISSQINKELLPKLGFKNIQFKFNAISLLDEKTIMEIMNFMKTINFDSDTIIHFAREHGLNLKSDAKIMETPSPIGSQSQDDTALSRQRVGSKNARMNDGMNKSGSSPAGAKKLQAKKVM